MLETFTTNTLAQLLGIINPTSRIYWLYLVSAAVMAVIAYWQIEKAEATEARQEGVDVSAKPGLIGFLFDPNVWSHPCFWQDLKFFIANAVLYFGIISQVLIGAHLLSETFHSGLLSLLGSLDEPLITGLPAKIGYTIAAVVALDFGVFLMHTLFHRIPFLWEFHKVHHSADQLTPVTLFRMHPVDLFLTAISVMVVQAVAYGLFAWMTGGTPQIITIYGMNVILFLFYVFGYNLRHSHIWLNYPAWLSNILISPAQHHIHHSVNPKHFDRNMGLIFAFWDKLFGTLYIPRTHEKLSYGISRAEPNPFPTVASMYIKPFADSWHQVKRSLARSRGLRWRLPVYAILAVISVGLLANSHSRSVAASGEPGLPSLHLEGLTWTEVRAAIDRGYTRVIVPTGGTEQNGPFVTLGKHNIIIRYTAEQIAAKAGTMLVAPVMAYVPEGQIEPEPEGHMEYAGTISLPPALFEAVLENTARSLKVHGFREIYFVGDSGPNQKPQLEVANRLSKEWQSQGIKVQALDQYYHANGQTDWLLGQGFDLEAIGTHAGIRDTSEVMALAPEQVRLRMRNLLPTKKLGINGQPSKASAEIGRKMLQLKVNAALRQMGVEGS